MNLCVERSNGAIEPLGRAGEPLATAERGNLLLPDVARQVGARIAAAVAGHRIVSWSGTLAESLSDQDPRNWMGGGRAALDRAVDGLLPMLAASGARLVLRPHARHVLSDVPSCLAFVRSRPGQPMDMALSPATMFEPSMLERLEDHLVRVFESLGPASSMAFLSDVRLAPDGESVESVPLGTGTLPRRHVLGLIADHLAPGMPVVLSDANLGAQMRWLEDSTVG